MRHPLTLSIKFLVQKAINVPEAINFFTYKFLVAVCVVERCIVSRAKKVPEDITNISEAPLAI